MKAHKVETRPRNRGFMARCLDCDATTFGGFRSRSEARLALAGHESASPPTKKAPGAAPTAAEGEESDTNHQESTESMNNLPALTEVDLEPRHTDRLALALAAFAGVEVVDVEGQGDMRPGDYNIALFLSVRSNCDVSHSVHVAGRDIKVAIATSPEALSPGEATQYAAERKQVARISRSLAEASLAEALEALSIAELLRNTVLLEVIPE